MKGIEGVAQVFLSQISPPPGAPTRNTKNGEEGRGGDEGEGGDGGGGGEEEGLEEQRGVITQRVEGEGAQKKKK